LIIIKIDSISNIRRTIPTFEQEWVERSKMIIEKAFNATNSPVVLVSHSMGGLVSRKFLDLMVCPFIILL